MSSPNDPTIAELINGREHSKKQLEKKLKDELKKTIDKSSKVHMQNNSKKSIFSKLKDLLIICRNRSQTIKVKEILSLLISCIEDNKIISPLLHALSSISFVDAEASESPRTISSLEEESGNQEVIEEINLMIRLL